MDTSKAPAGMSHSLTRGSRRRLDGGGLRVLIIHLQGAACLQKQSLSQPLALLRRDSMSLLLKGASYCHQGLSLTTE